MIRCRWMKKNGEENPKGVNEEGEYDESLRKLMGKYFYPIDFKSIESVFHFKYFQ